MAVVVALGVSLLTVIGVSATPSLATDSAGAAAACHSDGGLGCTATLPCSGHVCPTVDVAPVSDLVDGQYIYVKATSFPTGDTMRVAICSTSPTISPDPTDPTCLNGLWEANYWAPTQVPISEDPSKANLSEVSVPAFLDASGSGDAPLPSHDLLNVHGVGKGFFCDDGANPCALEITEEVGTGVGDGPPDSSVNTVDFPISFRSQAGGCPTNDPTIQTDSSFSLEHFLPSAVDATCKGPDGVVALNTATDNLSDISDLKTGGAQVSFIDDPGDPNIAVNKSYTYVPIALSATVVGFLAAQNFEGQIPYALSEYKLTPNMVAGLITSEYETPDGSPKQVGNNEVPGFSDNLIPPLKCAQLINCPDDSGYQVYNELDYNTFNLLNPSPANVTGPEAFGSFMSNISTGSSYQVTDWICKAPNVPIPVTVDEITKPHGKYHNVKVMATDQNIAGTTLTSAPIGTSIWPPYTSAKQPNGPAWVFPTCQGYATFPSLASSEANYGESQNPSFQAKSIRAYAYGGQVVPGLTNVPYAAFGVMDSSEADFNGLNSADLQNADGAFVYPSAQNVDAAVSGATPCPAGQPACPPGTFNLDYTTAPAATSYPMPDITYAVFPTKVKGSQAAAVKDLLTNLVTYSHGSNLPEGYAPLPENLYQAAVADIAAVFNPKPIPKKKSGPTVGSANGSPGSGAAPAGAGSSDSGLDTGATGTQATTLPLSTARTTKSSGDHGSEAEHRLEFGPHTRHPLGARRGVQVPLASHAGTGRRVPDRRSPAVLPPRIQAPAPAHRRIGVTRV